MAITQSQNSEGQASSNLAALIGDTQTSEGSAEQALNDATKTLFRAWSAYAAIDSHDGAEPQALATAWLKLWRAQAQHAQLVAQFEWPSAEMGTGKSGWGS
jgi:hypothetical protein